MNKGMILSIDIDHFPGSEIGVQRILDLLEDRGLKSTFFIAGKFAEECPSVLREIDRRGHEIGCHGYAHGLDLEENFALLTLEEQKKRIGRASEVIGRIIGREVTVFRAPYAKANSTTITVLESRGYTIDSSVAARRFDFGMGVANSVGAFFAPTKPYHPSRQNIFKDGDSEILEVPISAFVAPLTLSAIRSFGVKRIRLIFNMAYRYFDPLVFYLHPWEVMAADEIRLWEGVPKRHLRNRGKRALSALAEFIDCINGKVEFIQFGDVLEKEADKEQG
ncbi:MAG: polysaccharide deacetylase family protein [Thermoplasmata archaeon]|nr:MAG: polysaccharide deacetylase family protein [Thermoplasmata archaeon]